MRGGLQHAHQLRGGLHHTLWLRGGLHHSLWLREGPQTRWLRGGLHHALQLRGGPHNACQVREGLATKEQYQLLLHYYCDSGKVGPYFAFLLLLLQSLRPNFLLTVLETILSRHSGSTREKEQPYILPWIVDHSSIMYDFTFTLLPTEIYMPCAIHQLVNQLRFTYLAF